MSHELVLEGKAYVNHSFQQCCIGIDNGKITAIKKILTGDKKYQFSKELLLPAGIDVHVHFRDPGMTQKETFQTGSAAAAFGGISCVFDMPNTKPVSITKQNLIDKKQIAERKSLVDFGLYAAVTKKIFSDNNHASQINSACHGFKMFLGETTNSLTLPSRLIQQALFCINPFKKPIFVHAEDNDCLQKHKRKENNLLDHHQGRPSHCETKAITNVISAAENTQTPVHICHVSSAAAIQKVQKKSQLITYGITPHHSLLNIKQKTIPQSWLKVNPPLRPKMDQQTLFYNVQQGTVFLLESDHAPHTLKEKEKDFVDAPSGIPGVETMYPLFLAFAEKKLISFHHVISLLCQNPATLLNLSKGRIAVDYDADIIAVNRKHDQRIRIDQLHSKAGWTPFEGFSAIFPSTVFIRGHPVIKDYEQHVSPGHGCMIPIQKE